MLQRAKYTKTQINAVTEDISGSYANEKNIYEIKNQNWVFHFGNLYTYITFQFGGDAQ